MSQPQSGPRRPADQSTTNDDLARWAALAEAATPGPWHAAHGGQCCAGPCVVNIHSNGLHDVDCSYADQKFIAEARTAVPRLLTLVAAQAEQIDRRRRLVGEQAELALDAAHATLRDVIAERDADRAQLARVRAVLDHAAHVSPSASMTVYAAEIRAALDGTP